MENFTVIDNNLIISKISNGAYRLYILLQSYCYGKKDTCYPSQERLSMQLNKSVRTIQRWIQELEDNNLIMRKRRGSISNIYTVVDKNKSKQKYNKYKEYLKTEHWVKTREKALKRADYRCQLCNDTKDLNVHHKTYENIGHEKSNDLIVLCHECHAKFHDKLIDKEK